jgi:hypothetical protein
LGLLDKVNGKEPFLYEHLGETLLSTVVQYEGEEMGGGLGESSNTMGVKKELMVYYNILAEEVQRNKYKLTNIPQGKRKDPREDIHQSKNLPDRQVYTLSRSLHNIIITDCGKQPRLTQAAGSASKEAILRDDWERPVEQVEQDAKETMEEIATIDSVGVAKGTKQSASIPR